MPAGIQTKPVPYCPDCGGQMKLRRPKPYHGWDVFWECVSFPDCTGSLDIDDDGKPIFDEVGVNYE